MQDTGFWLLKNDNHKGRGLSLVSTSQAFDASLAIGSNGRRTWKLAQQYIANPFLLDGRKFGVRLYTLIPPGFDPFRVYVHKASFADLAEMKYNKSRCTQLQKHAFPRSVVLYGTSSALMLLCIVAGILKNRTERFQQLTAGNK